MIRLKFGVREQAEREGRGGHSAWWLCGAFGCEDRLVVKAVARALVIGWMEQATETGAARAWRERVSLTVRGLQRRGWLLRLTHG